MLSWKLPGSCNLQPDAEATPPPPTEVIQSPQLTDHLGTMFLTAAAVLHAINVWVAAHNHGKAMKTPMLSVTTSRAMAHSLAADRICSERTFETSILIWGTCDTIMVSVSLPDSYNSPDSGFGSFAATYIF
jgi:hypothetical protein